MSSGVVPRMRLIRRIALTLAEAASLFLLSILAIALAGFFNSAVNLPSEYGLLLGSVFSLCGLLVIQATTAKWKNEYEAARWIETRSEVALHPNRARYRRLLWRSLLWLPSGVAALVLFFFPVVTHLLHPFSHYLKHYRIPVPWTWTVLSPPFAPEEYSYASALISTNGAGRFGMTPFSDGEASFSVATFGSLGPDAAIEFNRALTEEWHKDAKEVSSREFHWGRVTLTCWQYLPPERRRFWRALPTTYWQIECATSADAFNRAFYAQFSGREQDMPAFYDVLEHTNETD